MSGTVEQRLTALGLELPPPFQPVANYVGYTIAGNLVFVSGMGPTWDKEVHFSGKVGGDLPLEQGQEAAQLTALNLLSHLKEACDGDLDRVRRCVKIFGLVNCTPDFTEQHLVINGASDLLAEALADSGVHARSAVAGQSLPVGIAVELDGIFEIG